MNDLSRLFRPRSIAVVGASRDANKIGGIVMRNIQNSGFKGALYPVNPKADEVAGLKCFKSVTELPEMVDMVVVAIPAKFVNQVLEEAGGKGIKNAVVFTAGYKEIGEEGKKLESELVEIAKKHGINVLGPNCLGFANNDLPVNVTFGQVVPASGNLRFISQSGAIASSIFDWFESQGLGYSEFATLGNKAVVTENEVLEYFTQSPREEVATKYGKGLSKVYPVGMYLESIVDGKKFLEVAKKIGEKDPIFVLKPGKSEAAAKAMQSHTGAIAGSDAVLEAAFEEAGVVRCHGIEDMFDLARAFSWEEAPSGPRVAVVSNAGGPAVISADVVSEVGLELAPLDDEVKAKLHEVLPRAASVLNPVDVLGDALANRYGDAMDLVLAEPEVDALIVILTPQVMTQIKETAELVGQMSEKYGKPIVCSFMGGSHIGEGEMVLNKYRIPSFRYPERAIGVLGKMWGWKKWQSSHTVGQSVGSAVEKIPGVDDLVDRARVGEILDSNTEGLDSLQVDELLKQAGIRVPESMEAGNEEKLAEMVGRVGFPLVVKVVGPKILHKKEINGIWSNISNFGELMKAIGEMRQRMESLPEEEKAGAKLQVQQQVARDVEVIVGLKRDSSFGGVVMFGAGGSLAELIGDRNLVLATENKDKLRGLVRSSKVSKLLEGYRGEAGYDMEALVDLMARLTAIFESDERIEELEINPVIVNREGVFAVDGKVVLSSK